jgi:hypothetical protein
MTPCDPSVPIQERAAGIAEETARMADGDLLWGESTGAGSDSSRWDDPTNVAGVAVASATAGGEGGPDVSSTSG